MPTKTIARRSRKGVTVLTKDQQGHVRDSMMRSAAKIASQLDEYIVNGVVTVAGREIPMTNERLASYRLVLDRTVPTLSSTEINHKSSLESMSSEQLMGRLAQLVKSRPELAKRLMEVSGTKVIDAVATTDSPASSSPSESPRSDAPPDPEA